MVSWWRRHEIWERHDGAVFVDLVETIINHFFSLGGIFHPIFPSLVNGIRIKIHLIKRRARTRESVPGKQYPHRRTCRISIEGKSIQKTIILSNVESIWLRFDQRSKRNPCLSIDSNSTFSTFMSRIHSSFGTRASLIRKPQDSKRVNNEVDE